MAKKIIASIRVKRYPFAFDDGIEIFFGIGRGRKNDILRFFDFDHRLVYLVQKKKNAR